MKPWQGSSDSEPVSWQSVARIILLCLFQPSSLFFNAFEPSQDIYIYICATDILYSMIQYVICIYTSTCFKQILFVAYLLVSHCMSQNSDGKKFQGQCEEEVKPLPVTDLWIC